MYLQVVIPTFPLHVHVVTWVLVFPGIFVFSSWCWGRCGAWVLRGWFEPSLEDRSIGVGLEDGCMGVGQEAGSMGASLEARYTRAGLGLGADLEPGSRGVLLEPGFGSWSSVRVYQAPPGHWVHWIRLGS
jgi:hypothetical protein